MTLPSCGCSRPYGLPRRLVRPRTVPQVKRLPAPGTSMIQVYQGACCAKLDRFEYGDSPLPPEVSRWLLLIHQLPTKPAYLRVKVWRRLQTLGAVSVKNTVYALPAGEQAQEDFEWLLKEISEGGGEGMICEARLIDGLSD